MSVRLTPTYLTVYKFSFAFVYTRKDFLFWKNVNRTEKPRERWRFVVVAVGAAAAAAACDVMRKECSTSSSTWRLKFEKRVRESIQTDLFIHR